MFGITSTRQLPDIPADELQEFILNEFAIGSKVINNEISTMIKLDNHFSLFTLITKVRRDFDFRVHHKKGANEFILELIY